MSPIVKERKHQPQSGATKGDPTELLLRSQHTHSQGTTVEELRDNLREVVAMLLEDGEPELSAEYVGTATVRVA